MFQGKRPSWYGSFGFVYHDEKYIEDTVDQIRSTPMSIVPLDPDVGRIYTPYEDETLGDYMSNLYISNCKLYDKQLAYLNKTNTFITTLINNVASDTQLFYYY